MNASRDNNFITGKLACLNSDIVQGTNLVRIKINSSTGGIKINTTSSVQFTMQPISPKDQNYANCWMFQGTNDLIYPAVADANGALLISL